VLKDDWAIMAESAEKYKEKHKPFTSSSILFIIIYLVAVKILHKFFQLPFTLALSLALSIAFLVDYWIPPKPPVSLPAWVLRIVGLTMVFVASLWLVPGILSYVIWRPVAYALPAFFLFLSKFWLPSLYAEKFWTVVTPVSKEPEEARKRRKNLIRWTLFNLVIAALFGVAIYYLNET
jgi:hypothetical protein